MKQAIFLLHQPFPGRVASSILLASFMGKYISFKTKAQKSHIGGMFCLHRCHHLGCWTKIRHKRCKDFGGALPASWREGLRPGPEHTRNPVALRM